MNVVNLKPKSKKSKSFWNGLKNWWKGIKTKRADKKLVDDLSLAVGAKPDKLTYNQERRHFELYWEGADETEFLLLKVGSSLAQIVEGEISAVVWIKFQHPYSSTQRLQPHVITDRDSIYALIVSCRHAIAALKLSSL